jgi:hypothetical protein
MWIEIRIRAQKLFEPIVGGPDSWVRNGETYKHWADCHHDLIHLRRLRAHWFGIQQVVLERLRDWIEELTDENTYVGM